jgi:hypothetical protein
MRIIAYDRRKTSIKFYGNDPLNPTTVFMGEDYKLTHRKHKFIELEERYIYRLKFKLNSAELYKGLKIIVTDAELDTSIIQDIELSERFIFSLLSALLTGDAYIENDCYVCNIRINKSGSKYSPELLTQETLIDILATDAI